MDQQQQQWPLAWCTRLWALGLVYTPMWALGLVYTPMWALGLVYTPMWALAHCVSGSELTCAHNSVYA